jgi:hypothetical protein
MLRVAGLVPPCTFAAQGIKLGCVVFPTGVELHASNSLPNNNFSSKQHKKLSY